MTLGEIHMAAEIFGSVFLAISAVIIIFELHQNVKQRKIQNTFMRSVEDENYFYKSMEKDFSKLFVKAGKPCSELEEYEKNQLKSFIFVTMSIINRDYLVAAETTYLQHRSRLKVRLNAHVKRVFSQPAIHEVYVVLKQDGFLEGYDGVHKLIDALEPMPTK